MADYTWRIPEARYDRMLKLLNEAAWASKRQQTARLQALTERLRADSTFPRQATPSDTITVEKVKTVSLSFTTHPSNPVRH